MLTLKYHVARAHLTERTVAKLDEDGDPQTAQVKSLLLELVAPPWFKGADRSPITIALDDPTKEEQALRKGDDFYVAFGVAPGADLLASEKTARERWAKREPERKAKREAQQKADAEASAKRRAAREARQPR